MFIKQASCALIVLLCSIPSAFGGHSPLVFIPGDSDVVRLHKRCSQTADDRYLQNDGKLLKINADRASPTVSPSGTGLYRINLQPEDVGDPHDPIKERHRSELVGCGDTFNAGEDVWQSYSMRIVGDQRWREEKPSVVVNQWHSLDTHETGHRAPIISFQFNAADKMYLATRSDSLYERGRTGATQVRWMRDIPQPGEWVHIVMHVKLGKNGLLQLFVDGKKSAEFEGPIGYYNDHSALAYMQFGIYRLWRNNTMTVEYANMEWGRKNLYERVAHPLPIEEVSTRSQ
jgi:hypothetical protein